MTDQPPIYRAYTIVEREKDVPFWLNIGSAFVHKDGKGFNVFLQALPLDGKLVLRLYEEPPEGARTELAARTKKKAANPPEQV